MPPSIPSNRQLICVLGLVLTSALSRLKSWGINCVDMPTPTQENVKVSHGSDCHTKLHGHFFKPIIKPTDSYYENHFNQLCSVTWISLSESALSLWRLCMHIVSFVDSVNLQCWLEFTFFAIKAELGILSLKFVGNASYIFSLVTQVEDINDIQGGRPVSILPHYKIKVVPIITAV